MYAGDTFTAATKHISRPRAEAVHPHPRRLLVSLSSASCAPTASGTRAKKSWKSHCERHLTANLDTLPYQCDPLIYAKTLAAPGLCFWCLGDTKQPATSRMKQYLTRDQWQRHIEQEHLAKSTCCKVPPACPHPRCSDTFKTLKDRDYHLQDAHCWVPRGVTKPKAGRKRSRLEKEDEDEDEEEKDVTENDEKSRKRTKRGTTVAAAGRRCRALPGSFVFIDQSVNFFGESNFYLDSCLGPYTPPFLQLLIPLRRLRCPRHRHRRRRWISVLRNFPMPPLRRALHLQPPAHRLLNCHRTHAMSSTTTASPSIPSS